MKIFKFLINLIEILIKEFLTLISPVIDAPSPTKFAPANSRINLINKFNEFILLFYI